MAPPEAPLRSDRPSESAVASVFSDNSSHCHSVSATGRAHTCRSGSHSACRSRRPVRRTARSVHKMSRLCCVLSVQTLFWNYNCEQKAAAENRLRTRLDRPSNCVLDLHMPPERCIVANFALLCETYCRNLSSWSRTLCFFGGLVLCVAPIRAFWYLVIRFSVRRIQTKLCSLLLSSILFSSLLFGTRVSFPSKLPSFCVDPLDLCSSMLLTSRQCS